MSYYIVYSYRASFGYSSPTIYHEGIYTSLDEAKRRQIEVCGEDGKEGINSSMHCNGLTVFINVIPQGACHIQTYTTSPS